MQITRAHNRSKPQAKAWVDDKIVDLCAQFGDSVSDWTHHWQGDTVAFSFRAAGMMRFQGTLAVSDTDLRLDMPFPLLAKGFEPRAQAEVGKWLDDNLPA